MRQRNAAIQPISIECCETKSKVITSANQNKANHHREPIRTQKEGRGKSKKTD